MARKKAGGKKTGKSTKRKLDAKAMKPVKGQAEQSSEDLLHYRQMYALSKKVRVEIFTILCGRIASPKEIADELHQGLSRISYHVTILKECRLIVLDNKEPRRGAVEHFYRAESTLTQAEALLDLLGASGRTSAKKRR